MPAAIRRAALVPSAAALALLAAGCTLTPKGADDERSLVTAAGTPYEAPVEQRQFPELPPEPTWRDILHRAFLANGQLEAAYFRWKAAMELVEAAGAWPNSDLSLGYSYAFSSGRMNAFDRSTFAIGFDPSTNLAFPTKTAKAAELALDQAKTAGEQFRVAKFDLQKRVLFAWSDYVAHARAIELKKQDVALRTIAADSGTIRAGAGEKQDDLALAQLGAATARSELRDLQAEHDAMRAMLNGLLARDPRDPLGTPPPSHPARSVPPDDATLLAAAVELFPEVAELAREAEGRQDALELARLRWIPDINPSLVFTGNVTQAIGAAITLPTTIADIRGRIREAEAQLRASDASLRQRRADRAAEYVSLVITLRSAQRRLATFEEDVRPAADRIIDARLRSYEAGAGTLADVVEAQHARLEIDLTIAQAESLIEKNIADIECCIGADIETLTAPPPPTAPPGPAPSEPSGTEGHHHD